MAHLREHLQTWHVIRDLLWYFYEVSHPIHTSDCLVSLLVEVLQGKLPDAFARAIVHKVLSGGLGRALTNLA